MIQDIAPLHLSNEYKPVPPKKDSTIIICDGRKILMRIENQEIFLPKLSDFDEKFHKNYTYLFSLDNIGYYMLKEYDNSIYEKFDFVYIEEIRRAKPKHIAFASVTGMQLFNWYKSKQYCSHCGAKLKHSDKERMLQCPECNFMEYPKISPAVIVGVYNKDKLLLSKYAGREYKNYALIAGFAEIGETIEETVIREVKEEVGLKVKNVKYYKSQPWSFSDTLLFGFFAELDGSEEITLDKEELSVGEWFKREEIPVEPDGISLTNEMIIAFKKNLINL